MLALLALAACHGDPPNTTPLNGPVVAPAARDEATLTGAGSTFVEPLLRQWIDGYKGVAPGVTVNYEGIDSGAARDRLQAGEGQFVASDVPMSDVEVATSGGGQDIVQIPWASGAIAVAYNLPDVDQLRLSPETLAGIYAGRVLKWNDAAVRADNPGVTLPNLSITVVYRSDPSGTTQVFTGYLEAASYGNWGLGVGLTGHFPRGQGASGSGGVASAVKKTSGAIGYLGLAHAKAGSLPVALLANRARRFVGPTAQAVNAALTAADVRPFSTVAQLYFVPASPGAYPLATFSYLIYRRDQLDPGEATALRHFAAWALTAGQRQAEPLGYVPVPQNLSATSLVLLSQP